MSRYSRIRLANPKSVTISGHDRFVRARFPNANPEHACWGYSCPDKDTWSLNSDQVAEWHKPPAGPPPTPSTFDFSVLPNAAGVVKNDSAQGPYDKRFRLVLFQAG